MKRVFASFVLLALLPGCAVVPAGTPSGAAPAHGASYVQGAPVAPTVYTWPPVRFSFSLGYTHRGDAHHGHRGHGRGKGRGSAWWGHFGVQR